MVEFETIRAEKINFGRNNFIEIARKKAIDEAIEKKGPDAKILFMINGSITVPMQC